MASSSSPEHNRKVTVILLDQQGYQCIYSMRVHTRMKKLMVHYCQTRVLNYNTLRFVYEGRWLGPNQTPNSLRFGEETTINVCMEMVGGGGRDA